MKTILMLTVFAGALALSACAPSQATTPAPTPVDEVTPAICKADDYQKYVGRNRSTIPTAPAGLVFRILCSSCSATTDFRENRVSFTYDDTTELVTRVSCG